MDFQVAVNNKLLREDTLEGKIGLQLLVGASDLFF